jgi:hypothetical protein
MVGINLFGVTDNGGVQKAQVWKRIYWRMLQDWKRWNSCFSAETSVKINELKIITTLNNKGTSKDV